MYSVSFKFNIDKKLAEETGDKFQIGGAFMGDPQDPRDSYMVVNSYLDIGFNEQDLNAYLGELKSVTIHEIQHGGQTDDVLKTSDPRTNNPMGGINWNYNKLDGVRGYYASESETDSYTKEVYKEQSIIRYLTQKRWICGLKQFFDMFRRRRDKMNAEDERETLASSEFNTQKKNSKTSFSRNYVTSILSMLKRNTQRLWESKKSGLPCGTKKKKKDKCSNPKGFTMKQFCKNQSSRSKKGERKN